MQAILLKSFKHLTLNLYALASTNNYQIKLLQIKKNILIVILGNQHKYFLS